MSIKRRLIISNVLVFLIPLVFSFLVVISAFHNFDRRFGSVDYYKQLKQIDDAYKAGDMEKIIQLCQTIEQKGCYVRFQSGGEISYESNGFHGMLELMGLSDYISDVPSECTFSNQYGELYVYTPYNESGNAAISLIIETSEFTFAGGNDFSDTGVQYLRDTMRIAFISIFCVVVITISLLTYIISRSILKPLKLLREGTQQIKNGNLRHSISYPQKDEFGEVCADFEDMRVSLLTLKEEERKYEENRKELIAGITHDLNTPLTSIKGYVSGLLEGIVNTPERQIAYLRNIKQTTDKMSKLVEELLLYSTLDMNGVLFTFEKVDLVEYFKDCLLELRDEFGNNKMYLHYETDCEHAYAGIDRVHFNRVVLNILWNSVKYKKNDNGSIYIKLSGDEKQVVISFKDDGLGIPHIEAGNIFKVFYRSDKSRNQSTGGNGLGLAIVQRIIAAHGGSVMANTEYTDGLEVIVTLPVIENKL